RERLAILVVFLSGICIFVYGISKHHWYIAELNAVFFAIGLAAAIIARLSPGETSRAFLEGTSQMAAPALIIGFARTIEVILTDGQIIDTIVMSVANLLDGMPPDVSAIGMLLVQSVCNFFIPSGSGQAFVTMPIMSPLATLTEVPQQTAVLAFQFGDGFTNMIVPTSAITMGALALGKIPYTAWFRFIGPLMLKILALASAVMIVSIHFGDVLGL
ncbi:MAG: TIGR00366 family protein, partial [Hyphomicrobiales bacterium]|nr:TIGR00366 family protein [Hyphomicrobiales bacterium]